MQGSDEGTKADLACRSEEFVISSSIHEKKIPFIFLVLNSALCRLQEFNPQHSE